MEKMDNMNNNGQQWITMDDNPPFYMLLLCHFLLFKSVTSASVWWSPWQCVFTCVTADLRLLAPRGSFTMSMKQIPSWCKSSQDLPICTFSDLHMPPSAVREEHVKRLSGLTRPSSQLLILFVNRGTTIISFPPGLSESNAAVAPVLQLCKTWTSLHWETIHS